MSRVLRLLFLVLYVFFFFSGCQALKETYSAYDSCKRDPACFAQMEKGRSLSEAIASSTASAFPQTAPVSSIVGSSVGQLVSILIGYWLGRKKRKD